ncbi:hypothetical protein [Streptomyces sp. NPDC002057]|uniref:hypothetical protein n=1 Tax=Streptomyces sp. NPDC002057 TaxID=3154664 RepID=UPI0033244075
MEPLTREHVFGQWVSKVGLDLSPVQHWAGPLNGLPRNMGRQPPYRQTVKNFCASCNNGWMSRLEVVAQRVLTPLILGSRGTIAPEDQALIAMWAEKTALTAMLLSSEEQRKSGYGLPPSVYKAFHECRDQMRPLDTSRFWVGRYEGAERQAACQVTPLTVRIPGIPEAPVPQGYAITLVLGALLLHGLFFTMSAWEVDTTMELEMPRLWPSDVPIPWPGGQPCTESSYPRLASGKMLRSTVEPVEIRAWARATSVPQSRFVAGKVRVPALCGRHFFSYPTALLEEAHRGRFYAFVSGCDCPQAYFLHTESESVRFKAAGAADGISQMYEDLAGEELFIPDQAGAFPCKRLPSGS